MIKKIIKYTVYCAIFYMFSNIFISCSREYLGEPEEKLSEMNISNVREFVGEKLENPYSLKNMRKAYKSLSKELIASANINGNEQNPINEEELQTTDYYVRFLIENDNQLEKLEADSLNFSVLPLDYEIKEGDIEISAENSEKPSYWIYTSVPISYEFPKNIKYELIEELFLPESIIDENDNEIQASLGQNGKSSKSKRFSKIFLENLEDQSLFMTGNLDEENVEKDLQAGWFSRIFRRRPSEAPRGHIFVENTTKQSWDPVIGVKVKTRRWFKWGHGWTNSDGWFHVNNSYRNPVNYEIVFKNSRGFKIWSTFVTISSARYSIGRFSSGQHVFRIDQYQRAWRFATANNAVEQYFRYCHELGIGNPPSNMRITVHNGSWNSAPMLRRVWGYYGFNSTKQFKNFVINTSGPVILTNALSILTKLMQPDIIIGTNGSRETIKIYRDVFHELSHASHFSQVGSSYWIRYINYIITYGKSSNPYGDGSGRNSGLVGLSEMWAYYMEYYLTLKHFGNNNGVITLEKLENFKPLEIPNNISFDRNYITGWIPVGLVHDLVDDNVDRIRAGYYDNVNGYTLSQIFWSMRPGVESIQALRDKLLQNNAYRQEKAVKNLFEAYYYK